MPYTPSRRVKVAFDLLRGALVALTVALAIGIGVGANASQTQDQTSSVLPEPASAKAVQVDRALSQHNCSTTGFGPGVIPTTALIEVQDTLKHVTFDLGWDVYTGRRTGTLVAVCQGIL